MGVASIVFGGAGRATPAFGASLLGAGISVSASDNPTVEAISQSVGLAAGLIVPASMKESIKLTPAQDALLGGAASGVAVDVVKENINKEDN